VRHMTTKDPTTWEDWSGLCVQTGNFYGEKRWVPITADDDEGHWLEWHGDRVFNDQTQRVEDKTMSQRIKAGLREATELKAANMLLDAVVDKCTEMVPQIEGVNRDVRRAGAALLLCHLYDHYGDSVPGVREYRDLLQLYWKLMEKDMTKMNFHQPELNIRFAESEYRAHSVRIRQHRATVNKLLQ